MVDEEAPRDIIAKLTESKLAEMGESLRNALTLLSEQLYDRDVHFVMELIQNAEDNIYAPEVSDRFIEFTVGHDVIEVHNNEIGFSRRNVEALCAVGKSTKHERTLGYIGEKGIGFKSVFQVSAEPAIFSSGFCFAFDDLNKIVPYWRDPPSHIDPHDGTTIVLKLRPDYRTAGSRPIGAQVAEIDPQMMLFLRKLTRIVILDKTSQHKLEFRREDVGHGRVRVQGGQPTTTWHLFARTVEVSPRIKEEKRKGVRQRELMVAFRTDAEGHCTPEPESLVFAFLPTEQRSGFPFLLQGDFLLTADRGAILQNNPWNLWLRDELGPTIVAAILSGVSEPTFALSVLSCVPLADEVHHPFFHVIAEYVIKHLPAEAVFMTESGRLRPASEVLRGSKLLRSLFPNEDLVKLLGRPVEYLHPDCEASASSTILDALCVRRFDSDALLEILKNDRWLARQSESWFTRLYGFLHEHEHFLSAEQLRALNLVLLENGQLACPADGTIYLPVREERLEERYGLSRFKWRLVAHAVVRRDPGATTDEGRAHNERTRKARDFLVGRLGVQLHRPLEIAVEQIFPYLEKQLAKPYGKDDLKQDFGLVLYLKEQWSEIMEASERPAAALEPAALVERASRCIPVPIQGSREDGVRPVGQTYMPAGFGGSPALERLLLPLPEVEFLSNEFVAWDPQRARDERKTEEWVRFLSTVGANQRLRLIHSRAAGRGLDSPGDPVPDGVRVTRVEGEIDAPELQTLLGKMATLSTQTQRERGQQLLRHLDDCWAEWERQHGGSDQWYLAEYRYRPHRQGNHQDRVQMVPAKFVRSLRQAAWVPTQSDQCLRPQDVWVDSGKVRASATRVGALLQGQITHPGLIRALGLRTDISADAIIGDLRRLVAEGRSDLGEFRSRFQQLAKLQHEGNLTDRDRETLNRDRFIYVPDRTPPFANALEVVWREPRELFARGFPALEHHYPGLRTFFASIGVAECMTPVQALRAIAGIPDNVYSDKAAQLRLWEAYQVLAGADLVGDAEDGADWNAELAHFRNGGRLLCRYNRFRPLDRVFAPDDERVVSLFGQQIDFLWVPEEAPVSVIRRLAEVLHLRCASTATKTVEATAVEAPPDFGANFDACRRPLIGYLRQEHQARYQPLFKTGRLGELAAAPLIASSALTVRYALGEFEVADSRSVHAMIDAAGVFVLVSDGINHDEVALAMQRDLGHVPAVAEVFTVLFSRRQREREMYARKRHYEVPDDDWQRILDSYQPLVRDSVEVSRSLGELTAPAVAVSSDAPLAVPSPGPTEDTLDVGVSSAPSDTELASATDSSPARSHQRGIPFRGRVQLPSPKGSNQRLRERLGAILPARRANIEEYFQDATPPAVQTLEARADEDGIVRRARTILRAANLEEAFLQFDLSAMAMFRPTGSDEIWLMGNDEEDPVLAKIDYDRAILHAGESNDEKVRFRAFLERDGLPPGAILELEATQKMDEYHLHPSRLDEPQILTDVSYWDFDDEGTPQTMSASSVRLPFRVHEATYRAERRWEQREAYAALINGNPGILADVYTALEARAEAGVGGVMATEIHRHLLSHDHPCGYSSVLGVLYGYACFAHDQEGRWHLIADAEQTRRAGYEKNIAADRALPFARSKSEQLDARDAGAEARSDRDANRIPASNALPSASASREDDPRVEPDLISGALSPGEIAEVSHALKTLGRAEKDRWLDAARKLATMFGQLARTIESSQSAVATAKSSRTTLDERVAVLIALARRTHEKDDEAALAAALLAWQVTRERQDRRQGDALRLIGLAMQRAGALRWALRCLEEASRRDVIVPKLADLREMAKKETGDHRANIVNVAQLGARKLRQTAGIELPELGESDWPAGVLLALPKA